MERPRWWQWWKWFRAGRLVEAVTTEEVEWDDDQQGWMIALANLEADKCPGCGDRLTETTKPDTEYIPNPPLRCHKCTALEIGIEKHRSSPHPHALLHTATKRDD